MDERERTRLRRTRTSADRTRLWVVAASILGFAALVVGVGALIQGTFPRPSESMTAASEAPVPASVAPSELETPAASSPASSSAPETTATLAIAAATAATQTAEAQTKTEREPPAAAPAPPQPTPPLGMNRILKGSRQLVVMTGAKLGSKNGTLRIYNLAGNTWRLVFSTPCRFGSNGLVDGEKRKEGSRTTPTGIWWPGEWVWGWHSKAPSGTKMPYRQTKENVWWSYARDDTYNTWVVSSKRIPGEHLVDVRIQYEYGVSTGYNAPPNRVVKGRGTAIFLHVFDPPSYHGGYSAGCIGVSRSAMIKVFRTLDPARRPCFAIGTEQHGTATSIEAL